MELRCEHKLHGIVSDGLVEVKCKSALCGHKPGVVVIHRFDPFNGELVETKRYKDTPKINKEGKTDEWRKRSTSVRHS
jgi:hypothetical protein